jgi:hypothetical protein
VLVWALPVKEERAVPPLVHALDGLPEVIHFRRRRPELRAANVDQLHVRLRVERREDLHPRAAMCAAGR